jgi:hypothetical protein
MVQWITKQENDQKMRTSQFHNASNLQNEPYTNFTANNRLIGLLLLIRDRDSVANQNTHVPSLPIRSTLQYKLPQKMKTTTIDYLF